MYVLSRNTRVVTRNLCFSGKIQTLLMPRVVRSGADRRLLDAWLDFFGHSAADIPIARAPRV